ncbi:hypothetical protein C8R45DRAFT_1101453 [Mycena sanguinolenta]|nr:hypothetical protein C8R45DRAFT_1101453 [Mycena sanguinolenta]
MAVPDQGSADLGIRLTTTIFLRIARGQLQALFSTSSPNYLFLMIWGLEFPQYVLMASFLTPAALAMTRSPFRIIPALPSSHATLPGTPT